MKRCNHYHPSGIVLLVVLSMLTFFSVMAAAYLVFSSQSRQTSFALAARSIKQPNTNAFMEEALMFLIRGTNDGNNPFFGEDLLSDYYGRKDATAVTTTIAATPIGTTGFVSVRVQTGPGLMSNYDDVFAGRIITFQGGAVENRSYRVLRSLVNSTDVHDLIIDLEPDLTAADITASLDILVNGRPRSSPGLGYDGNNINQLVTKDSYGTPVGYDLPFALQPNHLTAAGNKQTQFNAGKGDFDESYDAADFNNWFLSHTFVDPITGVPTVTPSFHRPAVINYILNQEADWQSPTGTTPYANVMASIARATMRPLPIYANQIGNTKAINEKFTGGNSNFGLRVPIDINSPERLNQIALVLTGAVPNAYDVDNDADGTNDSIWIDIGLPVFSSPEGKLVKPLIAVMIEDLGGRLNVNAHSNYALVNAQNGLWNQGNRWAGFPANPFVFRGLGFGPAEINIPAPTILPPANPNGSDYLSQLLASRYQEYDPAVAGVPGAAGADALSVLTDGWRPGIMRVNIGYGSSIDPYGRGGVGISDLGNVISANSGIQLTDNSATTTIVEPDATESAENPYEFDPSGRLGTDHPFTLAELEAVLRSNEFGSELLPGRLRELLRPFLAGPPGMDVARTITTSSHSDESPSANDPDKESLLATLTSAINPALTNLQVKSLIAPELRLANRLNVNRPFGDGIDNSTVGQPGYRVIDEPSEFFLNGVDDDGDGQIDEADEIITPAAESFASQDGATIHSNFTGIIPKYDFDAPTSVDARQLLARHLYVLMMTLSKGLSSNNYPTYGDTLATAVPVSDRDRYRARRIAQWAVNVVDYRDPDSINTAFEYDENISDGWNVDGNILTNEANPGANGIDDDGDTLIDEADEALNVVFGVENPELVFSESMAMHDVRVRDTNWDTSNKSKGTTPGDDADTDQVRIPQGSLFLELYCPRERLTANAADPETAGIPRELYDVNESVSPIAYALDLDRTVPTHFDNNGTPADPTDDVYGDSSDPVHQIPVWRIAISEPHAEKLDPTVITDPRNDEKQSAEELRRLLPDTLSFEPDQLDEIRGMPNKVDLERFVFFTDDTLNPAIDQGLIPDIPDRANVFYNLSGTPVNLLPEQYLTLAPRSQTHFGSQIYGNIGNYPPPLPPHPTGPTSPSNQGFFVRMGPPTGVGLIHDDFAGMQITPDTSNATGIIQPGLSLAISQIVTPQAVPAWMGPYEIGLNVSEPLATNYYREPQQRYTTVGGTYPLTDAYVEVDSAGIVVNGMALDQPEDMRVNGPVRDLVDGILADPNVADPMLGSFDNYRTAFLQRLADPTRGFHPVLNPYQTVDQIAIDLTIFSGEESSANVTKQGGEITPGTPSTPTVEGTYATGTRQRDGVGTNGVGMNLLHSYHTVYPPETSLDSERTDFFALDGAGAGVPLTTTLNYLNAGFGPPKPTGIRGRPATPFAMQPWLNRPFASPYELMLVPACSQGRLFEEFSVVGVPDPPVYPDKETDPTQKSFADTFIAPYRHLLNFFHSSEIKSGTAAKTAEFGRLFDLVCTPPRFRGELEPINPARVSGTPLAGLFSAPFNMIDDNNRVGRINLNTLANFDVWRGLMQGHMNEKEYEKSTPPNPPVVPPINENQLSYDFFLNARRGYIPPGGVANPVTAPGPYNYVPTHFDPRYPTQFTGVFTASVDGQWAPAVRDHPSTTDDDSEDLRRRSASASLLRGLGTLNQLDPVDGSAPSTTTPMFVRGSSQKPADLYTDRQRNPFTRYQTLLRMPNLVSNNSQVYLIRLTMGFFEVDAGNTNSLGSEYNASFGQEQRFKAMYIVDRSIPVGFIPGKDFNARDVVVFESHTQ